MRLLQLLLQRPVALLIVCASILAAGTISLSSMSTKLYPDTRKTRVQVSIPHPALSARQFADENGRIIYEALSGLDGLDFIETEYGSGQTNVRVEFEWGISGYDARRDVESAMSGIERRLPEDAQDYDVRYWAGRTAGFYAVAAYSSELSDREIYESVEPLVSPGLAKVKNADFAQVNPVNDWSVEIILNPTRLLEYGLRPDQVYSTVRQQLSDYPVGNIRSRQEQQNIRISLGGGDPWKIGELVVGRYAGAAVQVDDVAEVKIEEGLPRRIYTINGRRAVVIFAMPGEEGNISELSQAVDTLLEKASQDFHPSIQLKTLVNPSEYIDRSIQNVIQAGLVGGVLAILVCFIFLGSLRTSILIALSLPLSLFLSFVLMRLFGVTINLISLGGLTLSVGMIVDATIVVLENIHRNKQEKVSDEDEPTVIARAVKEIVLPVTSSIITSIVVFLPIILTTDLTSAVLGDLALCVIFVLFSSLVVALLLIPALSGLTLGFGKGNISAKSEGRERFGFLLLRKILNGYLLILRKSIHRKLTSVIVLATFVLAFFSAVFFVLPTIEKEILAKPASARVSLSASNRTITDTEDFLEVVRPLEQELLNTYEEQIISLFGRVSGLNTMNYTLTLKSTDARDRVISELQNRYRSDEDWNYLVRAWDPADLPLPRSDDLKIRFFLKDPSSGPAPDQELAGSNLPDQRYLSLNRAIAKAVDLIRSAGLYKSVEASPATEQMTTHILHAKNEAFSQGLGISVEQMGLSTRLFTTEVRAGQVEIEGETVDVKVLAEGAPISSIQHLQSQYLASRLGPVPFSHFFDLSKRDSELEVFEIDGEDVHYVYGDLGINPSNREREAALQSAMDSMRENFSDNPEIGYMFEDGRIEISRSQESLQTALLISVILVLIVLGIQFDSFLKPFVIALAIPLGLTGVIVFLKLFGSTVSLNSLLGTILLCGLTVNNSILLLDVFSKVRSADIVESLIKACEQRFRPIFMTTLTTLLGMLPIALALGEGANVIQPLGVAVSGGLLVSTLSTLFVVPALLRLVSKCPDRKSPLESSSRILPRFGGGMMSSLLMCALFVPIEPASAESRATQEQFSQQSDWLRVVLDNSSVKTELDALNLRTSAGLDALVKPGDTQLSLRGNSRLQTDDSLLNSTGWQERFLSSEITVQAIWELSDGEESNIQGALLAQRARIEQLNLMETFQTEASRFVNFALQMARANRLLELATLTTETRQLWLQDIRAQIRSGRRPQVDALEFEIQETQARSRMENFQREKNRLQEEAQAAGWGDVESLLPTLMRKFEISSKEKSACTPKTLLNSSIRIRRLREEIAQLQLQRELLPLVRTRRPRVTFATAAGMSLLEVQDVTPFVRLSLDAELPLLSLGSSEAETEVIRQQERALNAQVEQLQQELSTRTRSACAEIRNTTESLEAQERLLALETRFSGVVEKKYREGGLSDFEWLSRQLSVLQARENVVAASHGLLQAKVNFWLLVELPDVLQAFLEEHSKRNKPL